MRRFDQDYIHRSICGLLHKEITVAHPTSMRYTTLDKICERILAGWDSCSRVFSGIGDVLVRLSAQTGGGNGPSSSHKALVEVLWEEAKGFLD
jgi:hypothetical protein